LGVEAKELNLEATVLKVKMRKSIRALTTKGTKEHDGKPKEGKRQGRKNLHHKVTVVDVKAKELTTDMKVNQGITGHG